MKGVISMHQQHGLPTYWIVLSGFVRFYWSVMAEQSADCLAEAQTIWLDETITTSFGIANIFVANPDGALSRYQLGSHITFVLADELLSCSVPFDTRFFSFSSS